MTSKSKRKPGLFPCCLGMSAVCVCAVILVGLLTCYEWSTWSSDYEKAPPTQAFNSALWRRQSWAEHDRDWPPRLLMVDCLLDSPKLDGLTYEEVTSLLGSPDEGLDAEQTITYYLGPERGYIRIDSEWLSVSFTEEEVVSRAWLWRD